MRSTSFFAFILIGALTGPAFAQAPPSARPMPVRGTVEKFDDHTLAVKSRDGATITVTLAPKFTVRTVVAKTLADIKPGDKVGITSIKGADNARQAIEIHVLPTNLPNIRMTEFPYDLMPESLMTNAEVAQVSSTPQGRTIKVTLNGKEEEFAVPPAIPIVGYGPGDPGLLQPGTAIVVFARKQPDGSLTAAGVTAEKDGVKPPM
jgi:hypothetical protein